MQWESNDGKSEYSIKMPTGRFSIHHYVGCGEKWFLSDYYFFTRKPLKAESLEEAKTEAIELFSKEVNKLVAIVETLRTAQKGG